MPVSKLVVDYDYEFAVYGIITQVKEYKLAWLLNEKLGAGLCKVDDLEYEFLKDASMSISMYSCEMQYDVIRLLKNRAVTAENIKRPFLIPEMKDYDFFVQVEGDSDIDDIFPNLEDNLRSVPHIIYIAKINVENLKSRDNLII